MVLEGEELEFCKASILQQLGLGACGAMAESS